MVSLSITRIDKGDNVVTTSQTLTLFEIYQASKKFSNTHNKIKTSKLDSYSIYALFQLYINMSPQQDLKHGIITKKSGNY